MTNLTAPLKFYVPLTKDAYQIAETFRKEQHQPEKAKQVYLNTLAVYAVNFYLQCMEVETSLEASDSWNLALRSLMDVADLLVKYWGRLECRPVLPNAKICYLPPETREDRVGYLVVEINEATNLATLLGFAQTAPASCLDLSQLNSLENLIEQLPEKEQSPSVRLRQLLQDKQLPEKEQSPSARLRQLLQGKDPSSNTEIAQSPEDTYYNNSQDS
ncbi:MAG: DUF1822 family protein [Symploca sp. SIO2E6]|nr:DUF1822 family protein [Symploca sp. SIO2E6]